MMELGFEFKEIKEIFLLRFCVQQFYADET